MAESPLVLLVAGFVLTTVLGGILGHYFQQRTWQQQAANQRTKRDLDEATKVFEEVSVLLDRRLYRMRRVNWVARRLATTTGTSVELDEALRAYRSILEDWNDNLNRLLTLVQTYFGQPVRERLQFEVHESFAAVGEELEQFVREVSAPDRPPIRVRPVGRRLQDLSNRVFDFNLVMLAALERERVGRKRDNKAQVAWRPLAVRFGADSPTVADVQRALVEAGAEELDVDGHFGPATDAALREYQQQHNLPVDGVAGPQTLQSLGLSPPDR